MIQNSWNKTIFQYNEIVNKATLQPIKGFTKVKSRVTNTYSPDKLILSLKEDNYILINRSTKTVNAKKSIPTRHLSSSPRRPLEILSKLNPKIWKPDNVLEDQGED